MHSTDTSDSETPESPVSVAIKFYKELAQLVERMTAGTTEVLEVPRICDLTNGMPTVKPSNATDMAQVEQWITALALLQGSDGKQSKP